MLENKYDFRKVEKEMQNYWEEKGVYKFDKESDKEIYSIDTPPPTVSGSLHIGHIFSYTQAEMIARFQRMQGKNVFYPFGFDDNGLPTERLVEKENKIRAHQIPRREFIDMCMKTTEKYEKEFRELWSSLGFSVDWNLQYETISPRVQKISQKSFIDLYKKGKAYIKESPVLWCCECQTSIAQAELESMEKGTTFNYIPFNVEEEILIIATTRPELLYGCVCLFINPEDSRYNKYIGKKANVPLYDFEIPIIGDEKVDIDKGTGIVMCATFGDSVDMEWFLKYNLPYKKVILPNGKIDESIPYIGGLKVAKGREKIIGILKERELIIKSEEIIHNVGIHERCGKEVEIIPSKQWYIDVLSEKERFLKAGDEINWYPESMKNRYKIWVENLKWDWCISRQRYYGVPFPVWYCKDCGEVILAEEGELPVDPLKDYYRKVCTCGSENFIGESSVLDTWATSSLTPEINARYEDGEKASELLKPMSMRTQAHEIIRTWAFYTIVKSLYENNEIPWNDIMICGFVMAKKGEKISKSKNNSSLEPKSLIENYSADTIRYWAANSKLGTDTMFSLDELKISNRFINKLWNASKFGIGHLEDYSPNERVELMDVDWWIIEKCKETMRKSKELLEKYEIGAARHEIDEFFWKDFCDYYIEIVKDRLYKPEVHGEKERKSAQKAVYFSLLSILKMYSIYVPHITEYIYQSYFKANEEKESLHINPWGKIMCIDNEIIEFGEELKNILSTVRKFKSEKNISLKSSLRKISIEVNEKYEENFKRAILDLKTCTHADEINIISSSKLGVYIEE